MTKSAFAFNALCVAFDMGLLASDVLSTFVRPTALLLSVCQVLSPLQYWLVIPAEIIDSLPSKVVIKLSTSAIVCVCKLGGNSVGLFNICASPLVAFQSAFTLTSAPSCIPASLFFSAVV